MHRAVGITGAESLPASSSGSQLQPQLSEDDIDLWSVWGHLVKNWEFEYKRKPQYIRVSLERWLGRGLCGERKGRLFAHPGIEPEISTRQTC